MRKSTPTARVDAPPPTGKMGEVINLLRELNAPKKTDMSEYVFGKPQPQAVALEEAVLGAIMTEKDAFLRVDFLEDHHFYVDAHQLIYRACHRLSTKGKPIDILTISEEMKNTGDLSKVGGSYFLTELCNRVGSSANIEYHARIIYQQWLQRDTIQQCFDTVRKAYQNDDSFEVREAHIEKMTRGAYGFNDYFRVREFNRVMTDAEKEPEMICLAGALLRMGDLMMLFAQPGVGKTILAIQLANALARGTQVIPNLLINEAAGAPLSGVYFDFEMFDKELQSRYTNEFDRSDKFKWPETLKRVDVNPEFDDFPEGADISKFKMRQIEKILKIERPDFIVIDNVTALAGAHVSDPAEAERIMNRLNNWRRRYKSSTGSPLTIVVIAHTTKRYNKAAPIELSNMGGAAAFGNFSPTVVAIGQSANDPDEFYIKQLKGRNGEAYGERNVIVCQKNKLGDKFLAYDFLRLDSEANLLGDFLAQNSQDDMIKEACALNSQGQSWASIVKKIAWPQSVESLRVKCRSYLGRSGDQYEFQKDGNVEAIGTPIGDGGQPIATSRERKNDADIPF